MGVIDAREIMNQLRGLKPADVEKFACQLLVLAQPGFHGSKTIHYAAGQPMKLVDTMTKDIEKR